MPTTYERMTVDHLGSGASEGDLERFQRACERVIGAFDGDAGAATDYVWHNGDWASRVDADVCIYCDRLQADGSIVPELDDDAAWAELAMGHEGDCEWVETRAHRMDAARA